MSQPGKDAESKGTQAHKLAVLTHQVAQRLSHQKIIQRNIIEEMTGLLSYRQRGTEILKT
jgi:hypothetical protein